MIFNGKFLLTPIRFFYAVEKFLQKFLPKIFFSFAIGKLFHEAINWEQYNPKIDPSFVRRMKFGHSYYEDDHAAGLAMPYLLLLLLLVLQNVVRR